ncbi:BrnA antitoxin family protein [Pseudomonas sp. R2.Fl]|nr:BrnA antitoxin family protein [Pseudomonas sp. R2.Fl]
MKAEELDRLFDEGQEDVLQYFDLGSAERPNLLPMAVDVELPRWMVNRLDQEARLLGVTRQSLIAVWLAERLEQSKTNRRDAAE